MRLRNHQVLGKMGAFEVFDLIDREKDLKETEITDRLSDILAPNQVKQLVEEISSIGFIRRVPHRGHLEITDIGREAFLLIKVINGGSLDSVVTQLSRLQTSRYSLITNDICGCFLDILKNRYDVEDVYICSPWIRLRNDYLVNLESVIQKTRGRIAFRLITRPPAETAGGHKLWREQILKTLQWFKAHNAEIVKLKRLHTKLYCAVGKSWQAAIFGSENLTQAGNVELGIRVDDEVMTKKLLSYFNQIYTHSDEMLEEDLHFGKYQSS